MAPLGRCRPRAPARAGALWCGLVAVAVAQAAAGEAVHDEFAHIPDLDTNKDGKVTKKEFVAYFAPVQDLDLASLAHLGDDPAHPELTPKLKDTEQEAKDHKAQMAASFDAMFANADQDNDGSLSREELAKVFILHDNDPHGAPPPGVDSPQPRQLKEESHGQVRQHLVTAHFETMEKAGKELIARWDKDGDGELSEKEFSKSSPGDGSLSGIFRRLDTDQSGYLRHYEIALLADGEFTSDHHGPEVIEHADANGDGRASLEEIHAAMQRWHGHEQIGTFKEWAAHHFDRQQEL